MRHLEPGGKLVVAIENQLGLKYFNACGEDHLGKPFMGIQDLYQRTGGPRTFGRQALSRVLARAGLPQQQWLYPYPDYKVPSIVLSDAALAHPDFQAHDLLLRSDSEDYSDNRQRIFDEALVNRVLAQNGLLGDFSNSFLVVAQRPEEQAWQPAAMAWTFAAVHRHRGMATETRFVPQSGGSIRVTKRRILPHEPSTLPLADGHTISLNTQDSDYFPGQQMAWAALAAHVRDGNVPALVEALRPWCETLLFAAQVGASPLLPVEDEAAALAAAGMPCAAPGQGATAGAGETAGEPGASHAATPPGTSSTQLAGTPAAGGAPGSQLGSRGRPLRLLSLPGGMMDLVPFNILASESTGRHQVIDQEWEVSCPVPAGWVLTRGVMHALQTGLVPHDELGSIARVVIALADACGYHATPDDVERWLALEEQFLRAVSVKAVSHGLYTGTRRPVPMVFPTLASQAHALHEQQQHTHRAEEKAEGLRQQLAAREQENVASLKQIDEGRQREKALEAQIQTLLGSRSWRWSGWLRTLRRRSRI